MREAFLKNVYFYQVNNLKFLLKDEGDSKPGKLVYRKSMKTRPKNVKILAEKFAKEWRQSSILKCKILTFKTNLVKTTSFFFLFLFDFYRFFVSNLTSGKCSKCFYCNTLVQYSTGLDRHEKLPLTRTLCWECYIILFYHLRIAFENMSVS